MQKLTLEEKACRVLEIISSDGFCEDLSYRVGFLKNNTMTPEEVEIASDKLGMIYMISHCVNKGALCYAAHSDWREELEKMYKEFQRKGYFKSFKGIKSEKINQ